jgi:hypothetical protein
MVQNALDAACAENEGCETLAFIDLSTRMALVTNSDTPESQDTLNTLCAEAALMLLSGDVALVGTKNRLHLFLRSDTDRSDALCCICSPSTDVAKLIPTAQACLSKISGAAS